MNTSKTTLYLSIAGVVLTVIAIAISRRSSASSTTSAASGGGVSSADLTSQVNGVNANAAAVTQALLKAQTTLGQSAYATEGAAQGQTTASRSSLGAAGFSSELAAQGQTTASRSSLGAAGMSSELAAQEAYASGATSVENSFLSGATKYATYDSGQRANVALGTLAAGNQTLSTIESGVTSRYATTVAGSLAAYGDELNALTAGYHDRTSIYAGEIAQYPTEFGSVGAQTSSQIASEAKQAASESASQAAASSAWANAIGGIGRAAVGAFSPTSAASSGGGGYSGPSVNAGSFGSWGDGSQAPATVDYSGPSANAGSFGSWGNPPAAVKLSGGNPVRALA